MNNGIRHRVPFFSQVRLLSGMVALFFLGACLDIPNTPEPKNSISHVKVLAIQKDKSDSSSLKINPESSATLKADVVPKGLESELDFGWYRDSLLGKGATFAIPANTTEDSVPNKLVVKDKEGNATSVDFKLIINSPPFFTKDFSPVQGDTLYGTTRTSFSFKWNAEDAEDNVLNYILELDTTVYHVGALESVRQSGFHPGTHLFRVIVKDSEGDSDTLPLIKFYVVDTLEAVQ